MKIKEEWKLRVAEFKQMDSRQRWSYFKTYYLLKCIIALILLAMVLHFGFDIRQNRREVLASGCLVDVEISPQGVVYLTDDYADLGKVLSKEQYHRLEWRLNYQNMQDGKYPVALCLDKTDIAGFLQTDASKAYLVFTNVNQDIAKNRQLVDYLFP